MPEIKSDSGLTQQLATSENWGQGGDFVFDPATGERKPAEAIAQVDAMSSSAVSNAEAEVTKTTSTVQPTAKKG